jgi:hypothetical protein
MGSWRSRPVYFAGACLVTNLSMVLYVITIDIRVKIKIGHEFEH